MYPVVTKVKCILACISKSLASRSRKSIICLCSALVKLHLKYSNQVSTLQYKRDVVKLVRIQQRITKMVRGLEHWPYA